MKESLWILAAVLVGGVTAAGTLGRTWLAEHVALSGSQCRVTSDAGCPHAHRCGCCQQQEPETDTAQDDCGNCTSTSQQDDGSCCDSGSCDDAPQCCHSAQESPSNTVVSTSATP